VEKLIDENKTLKQEIDTL